MISIQNLKKAYGNSVIFNHASFTFPDKGLICILGPSGCGKSTLLNLLAGFDTAYEGEISVCGTSLSEMKEKELCAYRRDNVGFVFQNYHLLSGYTTLENVMLASEIVEEESEESRKEAKELLQKLGLSDKENQKIETLSGGQKQRVAIARALIHNPSVILADEPTGALDRKNSNEIMELLKSLAEDRLVLVITHDKKCAEFAEQIVTIENGKLVSEKTDVEIREEEIVENHEEVADEPHGKTDIEADIRALQQTEKEPRLYLWKRAFKNFRVHLLRYITIACSIAFGVLCFMLSLSSENIMKQSVTDFENKNTAYHNGYIKLEDNEKELLEVLKKDERIENIYLQYVLKDVNLKIGEQEEQIVEKYPMAKATEQMSYGVMPRRGKNEIAISPSLAAKFEKNIQNLIGKSAEVTYADKKYVFTVSGIFNASYDDFFISADIEQKLYEGLSVSPYSISYDVKEFEDIVAVSDSLEEQKINSQNASFEVAAFLETFQNLKRLFMVISVLVFVIGLFISVILLFKQQNTRMHEVGLLSALGYGKGHIQKILLYENLLLAVMAVLGNLLFLVLTFVISRMVGFLFAFTFIQMLMALVLTVILVLIIGFLASLRLIRVEPAEALRS